MYALKAFDLRLTTGSWGTPDARSFRFFPLGKPCEMAQVKPWPNSSVEVLGCVYKI